MSNAREQIPDLSQLLYGAFYQHWNDDHDSRRAAIIDYLDGAAPEVRVRLSLEMTAVARDSSDAAIVGLFRRLQIGDNPVVGVSSAHAWLESAIDVVNSL